MKKMLSLMLACTMVGSVAASMSACDSADIQPVNVIMVNDNHGILNEESG